MSRNHNSKIFLQEEFQNFLPHNNQQVINDCAAVAENNQIDIYLIGGVVRDLLLRRPILDVDIIVEGDAIRFAYLLEEKLSCKVIQTQENLRTAKVIFENSVEIDFASTRCEKYPEGGSLPIVEKVFCPLNEDVKRRDFTINTMAMTLCGVEKYLLVDYLDGYDDLKSRLLRVLHQDSFADDPSRIVRGLKFMVRFNFELEKDTATLQRNFLDQIQSRDYPFERIRSEIEQLFSLNSARAYDDFVGKKIYKLITDKPFLETTGIQINKKINLFKISKEDIWLVYLGCLLQNEDKSFLTKFNLSNMEQNIILDSRSLVLHSDTEKKDNYSIYKFFNGKELVSIVIYYILTMDETVFVYLNELEDVQINVSGKDLISLGLEPSPVFSELLEKLLKEKLNNGFLSKADEIEYIKSIL